MRSRGLVVAIAIVLAIVAAAAVILYTNQVREDAITDEATQVVIATQDIHAGTAARPARWTQGVFDDDQRAERRARRGRGHVARSASGPDHHLHRSWRASRSRPPAWRPAESELSQVGVSKDHVGVALVPRWAREVGAGAIRIGDHVAVYVTYNKDTVVLRRELRQILAPAQLRQFFESRRPTRTRIHRPSGSASTSRPLIVPSTRVIQAAIPTVTDANGQTGSRFPKAVITLMLDLLPEDAQSIVFAQRARERVARPAAAAERGRLPGRRESSDRPFDELLGNAA